MPSALFILDYLLAASIAGVMVWHLLFKGDAGENSARERAATILIGTGFAPFGLALLTGLLLLVARGLSRELLVLAHVAALGGAAYWLRRAWRPAGRDLVVTLFSTWIARAGVLLFLVVIVAFSRHAYVEAIKPQRHYDATTYALDARRIMQNRSTKAIMPLAPTDHSNEFANHNHGSSYQFFLAASLTFGSSLEDLPLRIAPRLLGMHILLVLAGLGLRVGGRAAVLAPILFLFYDWMHPILSAASRDVYRMLAVVVVLGLVPMSCRLRWDARAALLTAALAFLLNTHASSLLVAPTLVAAVAVVARPLPRAWLVLAAALGIAFATGGSRFIISTVQAGHPLALSPFSNVNYLGTSAETVWQSRRGLLPPGFEALGEKLGRAYELDGEVMTIVALAGLAGAVLWCLAWLVTRRPRPPDAPVVVATVFLLLWGLFILGVFDAIVSDLSSTLTMNPRYRAHLYPVAAFLAAAVVTLLPARGGRWLVAAGSVVLLVFSVKHFENTWRPGRMPGFTKTRDATRHLADDTDLWGWVRLFEAIPKDAVIAMDYAYLGWYLTDRRILFTQDPRLRPAFVAGEPDEARAALDDLGIQFLFFIDLEWTTIRDAELPLAAAVSSDAYQLIARRPGWRLFRRTPAGHETPSCVTISDEPTPAWLASRPVRQTWQTRTDAIRSASEADVPVERREAAIDDLLAAGVDALPALDAAIDAETDPEALDWLRCVRTLLMTESVSVGVALETLETINDEVFPPPRFQRVGKSIRKTYTAPQLRRHIEDTSLVRGISRARGWDDFYTAWIAASAVEDDHYRVHFRSGREVDFVAWLTERLGPPQSPPAETP